MSLDLWILVLTLEFRTALELYHFIQDFRLILASILNFIDTKFPSLAQLYTKDAQWMYLSTLLMYTLVFAANPVLSILRVNVFLHDGNFSRRQIDDICFIFPRK